MSGLSSLNVALSGLLAQQRALDVTGENVANANTEGYSRQRIQLQSIGGTLINDFWTRDFASGAGVQVSSITRFRDAFLETRGALERGAQSQLAQTNSALNNVEALFNEPSDQAISKSLSDLWAGFDDVANNPSDGAARQELLSRASDLATSFNHASKQLTLFRSTAVSQLQSLTTEINAMASNVASLNDSIQRATLAGGTANELMDQRDLLVQQLAAKVGATIRQGENGTINVFVNGGAIVSGTRAETLSVDTTGASVAMRWGADNRAATITTGDAGGMLGVINVTLPKYQTSLDAVAVKLRDDVNALHTGGVGLDGGTGRKFFDGTGASDLAVSSDIGTDPNKIAAGATGGGALDASVALQLASLADSTTGADSVYRSFITGVGVDAQSAQRRSVMQDATVAQIDSDRQSNSGVNTDEEMVSMVQFQHAYNASARFLTAIDQMLDTLVNHTGMVGM